MCQTSHKPRAVGYGLLGTRPLSLYYYLPEVSFVGSLTSPFTVTAGLALDVIRRDTVRAAGLVANLLVVISSFKVQGRPRSLGVYKKEDRQVKV